MCLGCHGRPALRGRLLAAQQLRLERLLLSTQLRCQLRLPTGQRGIGLHPERGKLLLQLAVLQPLGCPHLPRCRRPQLAVLLDGRACISELVFVRAQLVDAAVWRGACLQHRADT
jgi:hypothetical protein